MQTRELYKTLVYNFSHGCRYSYNAYLETLKSTVSTLLYILMWQDSICLLQTDTYLKIPSIIPNDLKSHIHKQANVTERSTQLYTCTVFMFTHSVCHRFQVFWDMPLCHRVGSSQHYEALWCCQNTRNSLPCDTASHPTGHESCTHSTIGSKD